jgi:hydroxyethylthiazole kinase-like uncharacterized protein yjeF
MTKLLTGAQMKAIETAAIASGEVSGLELMERAGRGVVEAVFDEWPELRAKHFRAVVLCGPGNNGGDGFVVARLLREVGWTVEVFALADTMTADAATMRGRWTGTVQGFDGLTPDHFADAAVVFDAIFGTGLTRPIGPGISGAVEMAHPTCRIVAIDIPSGICADSGRYLAEGEAGDWPVDLTVTFGAAKLGHHLDAGARMCGKLIVVPIGVEDRIADLSRHDPTFVQLTAAPDGLAKAVGHKFAHGHALILSGGAGHGGAARMTARGALRVGAGLVTLGCPPEAVAENAARLDAVMLKAVADAAGLEDLLADARITALCLGPGMGVERAAALLPAALQGRGGPRPAVLDADALTALARDGGLVAMLHGDCVLTPHGGEFARLFPDIAARLAAQPRTGPAYSKVDATREAAVRAGCVVLFKGADTVVASPDGRCAVNSAAYDRAAPWLATAGAGDVLAGLIAGLLAQRMSAFDAAACGAWLHGDAAARFGPGLIAEDLPEMLPEVLTALR